MEQVGCYILVMGIPKLRVLSLVSVIALTSLSSLQPALSGEITKEEIRDNRLIEAGKKCLSLAVTSTHDSAVFYAFLVNIKNNCKKIVKLQGELFVKTSNGSVYGRPSDAVISLRGNPNCRDGNYFETYFIPGAETRNIVCVAVRGGMKATSIFFSYSPVGKSTFSQRVNLTVTRTPTLEPNPFSDVAAAATLQFASFFDTFGTFAAATAAAKDRAIANKAAGITCPVNGKCGIGNTGPGGGIVFYIAPKPQPWGQYLEVAPITWNGSNSDPEAPWCDVRGVSLVSAVADPELKGLIGDEIGKGKGNTQLMTGSCKSGAANLASAYRGGGKSDWFLPSKDELNQLCQYARRGQARGTAVCNSTGILKAEFAIGLFWSSSESLEFNAWLQTFNPYGDGSKSGSDKTIIAPVRPVRAFG